jgi:hypothetical protein
MKGSFVTLSMMKDPFITWAPPVVMGMTASATPSADRQARVIRGRRPGSRGTYSVVSPGRPK